MVTHNKLGLNLLHCLKRNADDDDDGRAAHREGGVLDDDAGDDRQDRDDRQIQSAKERDLVDNLQDEVRGRLARAEAGMKPPFFLRLLAISIGLNWIVA